MYFTVRNNSFRQVTWFWLSLVLDISYIGPIAWQPRRCALFFYLGLSAHITIIGSLNQLENMTLCTLYHLLHFFIIFHHYFQLFALQEDIPLQFWSFLPLYLRTFFPASAFIASTTLHDSGNIIMLLLQSLLCSDNSNSHQTSKPNWPVLYKVVTLLLFL